MADFEKQIEQREKLPRYSDSITLTEGQKLADDAGLLEFCTRKVPTGKKAVVRVRIAVVALGPAEEGEA
jgi:hypothetical protein